MSFLLALVTTRGCAPLSECPANRVSSCMLEGCKDSQDCNAVSCIEQGTLLLRERFVLLFHSFLCAAILCNSILFIVLSGANRTSGIYSIFGAVKKEGSTTLGGYNIHRKE